MQGQGQFRQKSTPLLPFAAFIAGALLLNAFAIKEGP
jgi:hypothetical protein